MTRERSEEVLVVAVVLSVALHILLMAYAKPKVMTQVAAGVDRYRRRAPMRVTGEVQRSRPVSIDSVQDVAPEKDAPQTGQPGEKFNLPGSDGIGAPEQLPEALAAVAGMVDGVKPKAEEAFRFKEEALKLDSRGSVKIPVVEIETPSTSPSLSGKGFFAPGGESGGAAAPAVPVAEVPAFAPSVVAPPKAEVERPADRAMRNENRQEVVTAEFTPSAEVFEKVDETIVEREKAAVRELVNAYDAEALEKFVNVAASASTEAGWTYFKVMFLPRSDLPAVPKDLVVLIDASGSIGKDRMGSIRVAAKRVLRSATNSGDRFNFVAFRDRYSYAFRSWQECTEESFAKADKWLSNVAAHGRTDVFSTIRSVLTLPRTPERPLIALVVTDGDANAGVRTNPEIISRFTALNDGLVSVYMYGVKSSANRELIDVLTRGNRGESYVFEGMRWRAGAAVEGLAERFRDPVLSDVRVILAAGTAAEIYPQRLKNLYRGGTLEFVGRVRAGTKTVSFSPSDPIRNWQRP